MRSRAERAAAVAMLGLALASCAGKARPGRYRPVSDLAVRIGPPYRIGGVTYVPRDDPGYDEVGLASWYGSESGDRTASGERFRPAAISAAHRTLPLPSYVEVTALDTGRTILVRINDRGPFRDGRIIDLSKGAAAALGMLRIGTARVRVRRVMPPERDRAALRAGHAAASRPDMPPRRLLAAPPPEPALPRTPLMLELPRPEAGTLPLP